MTYLRAEHEDEVRRQYTTFKRLINTNHAFLQFINDHAGIRERILDLGCGMGCFTMLLAEQFGAKVEGWDVNDRFLTAARMTAKKNGLGSEKLQYRQIGFFDAVPPELVRSFDLISFREAIMCIDNPAQLLAWSKQLLTNNGYIAALEPDYGMTTIYPEIPHWQDFFSAYSQYSAAHGENFAFGRSLLDIFQKARLKDIAVSPLIEMHTGRDKIALKNFMDIEIQSINQDMDSFVSKTGYSRAKIDEVLNGMKYLHRYSGAYVQTHMVAICGKI